MRKIFLLLGILLASTLSYAQVTGPSALQKNHNLFSGANAYNAGIGIKGGLNFSTIRGSDKDKYGSTSSYTSFHAGAFAQFALGETFSVQPEVLYSRQGYERADSTFTFNYLSVPMLAVFNFTDNLSLHLGPQIGLMLAAEQEDVEVNMEHYNSFDYGAAAGLEARISRFRLGARYNMYFADLRKENSAGSHINEDIKNGVLQVYLGIGF